MVIVLVCIIVVIFICMFIVRVKNNGTIGFHRDPKDRRRKRNEPVESPEITQGWQI